MSSLLCHCCHCHPQANLCCDSKSGLVIYSTCINKYMKCMKKYNAAFTCVFNICWELNLNSAFHCLLGYWKSGISGRSISLGAYGKLAKIQNEKDPSCCRRNKPFFFQTVRRIFPIRLSRLPERPGLRLPHNRLNRVPGNCVFSPGKEKCVF